MDVLVSVVIPVYNVENYLERCLNSIEAQTFREFEVILIDDGSTDTSGNICDCWCAEHDKYIVIHQKNGGVSKARNTGLDKVSGKYVTFVDPDDFIYPDYLMRMVDIAERQNAQLVHCNYVCEKRFLDYSDIYQVTDNNFFDAGVCCTVWANLFCAEVINRNVLRFAEHIHSGEDTLFTTQYYLKIGKAMGIPDKLYYYEQESGGITHMGFSQKRLTIVDAFEEIVNLTGNRPCLNEYAKRLLAGKTLGVLFLLWKTQSLHQISMMRSEESRMISVIRDNKQYLYRDAEGLAKAKLFFLISFPNIYKVLYRMAGLICIKK